MKITVLAGGFSPERDVSLVSGSLIANSLCKSGYEVALADILFPVNRAEIPSLFRTDGGYHYAIPKEPPDLDALRQKVPGTALVGDGVLELCAAADLVFLALHGGMGEDGRIQAILSSLGIRYTGSSFSACLVAMDKSLTKRLFRATGVSTANFHVLEKGDDPAGIPLPCVVKPCSCGSSVGVSMAETEEELRAALSLAYRYEDKVLVEDKIVGREFSVGILNGRALPAIEIRPKSGFYDYERKYQAGMTEEICPAPLSDEEAEALGALALKAHRVLGLGAYSRIDIMQDENSGRFFCLEANTLPGMTPNSLLPQEAAAIGIDYDTLCRIIAESA